MELETSTVFRRQSNMDRVCISSMPTAKRNRPSGEKSTVNTPRILICVALEFVELTPAVVLAAAVWDPVIDSSIGALVNILLSVMFAEFQIKIFPSLPS